MTETVASASRAGPEPGAATRTHVSSRVRFERLAPYAYVAPAVAIVGVFVVVPIAYSFYLSLHAWDFIRPAPVFIGFDNYRRLFAAPDIRRALANTLAYTAGTVPLSALLGLTIAVLLNRALPGRAVFRAAFFTPVVTSTVAMSVVWAWIYHPQVGLMNALLRAIGLPALGWLTDPRTAMLALVIMSCWKGLGYDMVLFLAGLQGIPPELDEAAAVDGATRVQAFRWVTLPLLAPATLFVLIVSTIDAVQVFTQVSVMTDGGPAGATDVLVYSLWRHAFQTFEMGYASALAWMVFLVLMVLTAAQMRIFRDAVGGAGGAR
jgi:ABC-type sugar transport system permease subunit